MNIYVKKNQQENILRFPIFPIILKGTWCIQLRQKCNEKEQLTYISRSNDWLIQSKNKILEITIKEAWFNTYFTKSF